MQFFADTANRTLCVSLTQATLAVKAGLA